MLVYTFHEYEWKELASTIVYDREGMSSTAIEDLFSIMAWVILLSHCNTRIIAYYFKHRTSTKTYRTYFEVIKWDRKLIFISNNYLSQYHLVIFPEESSAINILAFCYLAYIPIYHNLNRSRYLILPVWPVRKHTLEHNKTIHLLEEYLRITKQNKQNKKITKLKNWWRNKST